MPVIFTVKEPKKPRQIEGRDKVHLVDFAHSARPDQRVYCDLHTNRVVMKYHPDKKLYHCVNCGNIIYEGYHQALKKKAKEDVKYGIITDPYDSRNATRNDGNPMAPIGVSLGRPRLDNMESVRKKESSTYTSASDAIRDTQEEWYQ